MDVFCFYILGGAGSGEKQKGHVFLVLLSLLVVGRLFPVVWPCRG